MKNNTNYYDIAVIGAGPAGMTAAIYSQRAESKTVMIDAGAPGGKMIKTSEIANYAGYESILGPDLSTNMFLQTQKLGVLFWNDKVLKVEVLEEPKGDYKFCINLKNKGDLYAKAVIIATGTVERQIGAVGEVAYYDKGVSYCAVCDGAFYKNMPVAVIGGGYAALEEAEYLTKFASVVYLIHRRQGFRADSKVVSKAKANEKITFILDTILEEVYGNEEEVKGIKVRNVVKDTEQKIDVAAVFPYIGADPITNFVDHLPITDDNKYIVVDPTGHTKIKGLFGAGDVTNTTLRQIVTATSDGAKAAQFAINYIDSLS